MNDLPRGAPAEDEAPINPYSLLEAVNDSSDTVHTGWLIFIAIMSYMLVAVAGVSHKDLLLSRDIPLPILQVGIEISRFFLFAPIVLVLFHVGVVTQLIMLARKTLELNSALRILEVSDKRTHPLRLELHNFFFVQAIAGPERSVVVNGLLHGLTWFTLVVLPVVMLLYIQVAFLPYHDVTITWAHRIALIADIGLLSLIGVFLSRPEQSLGTALWRAGIAHPLTFLLTVTVLGAVTLFSFFVATVPGERLDQLSRVLLPEAEAKSAVGGGRAAYGFVVPFIGISKDGKLFGLFERNLNVTDHDLVIDKDVTPNEPTLNLRRRDLRFARLDRTDIHQADLTGSNLDGASLVGADLRNAYVHCADINLLLLTEDRKAASCPSARGANFTQARLGDANLSGIDLTGARLEDASLSGVDLAHSKLTGANFYSAKLERAVMTSASLQGANLSAAALQGADLTGANLYGADLSNAQMQGAILEFTKLHGASLEDSDLEGANLYQAQLLAAKMAGANLRAASLKGAAIWLSTPPSGMAAALTDLTDLKSKAPEPRELAQIDAQLNRLANRRLEERIREKLAVMWKVGSGDAKATEAVKASQQAWAELIRASGRESPPDRPAVPVASGTDGVPSVGIDGNLGVGGIANPAPAAAASLGAGNAGEARGRKQQVTTHLADLACKTRWANGSVATGLARRALSVAFNGDPGLLYERIRAANCPASKTVSPEALKKLSTTVEQARGN